MTDNTEPLEVDHPAKVMAAITDGRNRALFAATYWRETAATLTRLRRGGGLLPMLPIDAEEWYEEDQPALPFDLEDMDAELKGLSGLITKAHTLATIYRERAEELGAEIESLKAAEAAAVARQKELEDEIRLNQVTPAELAAIQRETTEDEVESDRLEAEHRSRTTHSPEQIAAAERVTNAYALVADHLNNEPSDDGVVWDAWNDSYQAAADERDAADKAYAALFDGRVPDARTVLGR